MLVFLVGYFTTTKECEKLYANILYEGWTHREEKWMEYSSLYMISGYLTTRKECEKISLMCYVRDKLL